MTFNGAEYYCLECGGNWGMMEVSLEPLTPELSARRETLRHEWDTHVGMKVITPRSWRLDCTECADLSPTNTHAAHATDDEIAAHEAAIAWLDQRCTR